MIKENEEITNRYSRQILFKPIGVDGQKKLLGAHALIVGCGALGTHIAELICRAGFGHLNVVDRDIVELSNLQRQALFTEKDAMEKIPKAIAVKNALNTINSTVQVEASVEDFNHRNAENFVKDVDIIFDGTDNFTTRFLINDVSIKNNIPWIYGACVGSTGVCIPIVAGDAPCFRCVFKSIPPPELTPTCDTAGIISPAAAIVASIEVALGLKLVTEGKESLKVHMFHLDCWSNEFLTLDMKDSKDENCPVCVHHQFATLKGENIPSTISLCGRNAVHISFYRKTEEINSIDFHAIAARLSRAGKVTWNDYILTFTTPLHELILFSDGRCIVKGTQDKKEAISLYSRYFGM